METDLRQRNGCITVWLWLAIIANIGMAILYAVSMFEANAAGIAFGFGLCSILCIVNILGAILLMRWNKTGFYIFVSSIIVSELITILVLNESALTLVGSFIAIIIWRAVLQAKKDGISAWKQMNTGWDYKHCRHLYQVFMLICIMLLVLTLIAAGLEHKGNDEKNIANSNEEDIAVELVEKEQQVKNMFWESPLGPSSYTGSVCNDSIVGRDDLIPNGYGVARIVDGEYKGNTYDGNFIWGVMEGKATYTTVDGDIFKGSFKNNKYHKGTYTVKETGEYFVGTFNNGQPHKGDWFDKDGNKL